MKLTSKHYDDQVKEGEHDPLVDQTAYQKLIGKLLYLNMTRPDISYSVQTLSQFLQQPKNSHMEAVLRIVRYIEKNPGQGILLTSTSDSTIIAYCDVDWAACLLTRRFVTGYVVKIGNSLISWKAKKQTRVSEAQQKLSAGVWQLQLQS